MTKLSKAMRLLAVTAEIKKYADRDVFTKADIEYLDFLLSERKFLRRCLEIRLSVVQRGSA